jgi:hypothetical protein
MTTALNAPRRDQVVEAEEVVEVVAPVAPHPQDAVVKQVEVLNHQQLKQIVI